ncbi:MAG: VTT domain-containing protein [Halioglobus sp.]|nr:VTT domain-containing protein [Halioglobus sp.]
MSPTWRRRVLILALVVVAYLVGSTAQEQLGISFSIDGLEAFRQWVQSLGWWGPAVFIFLVIFRLFIGLSSHLILILGGLAFGVTGGIIWGSIGLVASALVLYYLAHLLGADWVHRRFGDRYKAMMTRIQRIGAVAIFAITAHPVGLLTPAHLAAGLVGMNLGQFAAVVTLASPIRAAPYAFLGTAVLDLTGTQSLAFTAILLLVFVVPLLIPPVRTWVWGPRDSADNEEPR